MKVVDKTITIKIADEELREEVISALSDFFENSPDAELVARREDLRKAIIPVWFPATFLLLAPATNLTADAIWDGIKLVLKKLNKEKGRRKVTVVETGGPPVIVIEPED